MCLRHTLGPERNDEMLLELRDVRVRYEKVQALKGISLKIEEGEIITLIGANGAGKSTTLRAISGMTKPSSGEIRFMGEMIGRMSPQEVVGLGIAHAPEGRRVFPDMTALENLKMGAYLRKDTRRIHEDLKRVYEHFPILSERKKQRAGMLSGGEQQMLTIGRALMSRPKLLLLDEPSLGLSPLLVMKIARIITDINRLDHVSIILVEQNSHMALRIARYGYVLETGNIALKGASKDLIDNAHVKKAYLGG